jgi:hypothetical protein
MGKSKPKVDAFDVVPGGEETATEKVKKVRKSPDERFEALMKKCRTLTITQKKALFSWLRTDIEETVKSELEIVSKKKAELEQLLGEA